ncbi:membrane protein [Amycolatopsis rifamycinica]|uniref:Membrane protein n=1 Tax=Amycolatopsis rifamycinica TaxID=287986 RepID=A0A066TZJ3_9PSEU|nr:membrane protein [Amycolatopsis rifamycinica]KDN17279.1 membrane protein [Amycolatopsis rifamycinica]
MTTNTAPAAGLAEPLRRLYFVRFAFALVWAGLLFATASSLGPVSIALLVLYPLFDVLAAVLDARSAKTGRPIAALYANVAISLLAAGGLAVAASSGIPGVLRVWGTWAIVAGVVQLVVGVARRGLGGQWPMILSGAISVVAGTSFLLQATKDGASLTALAGYATLGGVFFLVSALRLGRQRGVQPQ